MDGWMGRNKHAKVIECNNQLTNQTLTNTHINTYSRGVPFSLLGQLLAQARDLALVLQLQRLYGGVVEAHVVVGHAHQLRLQITLRLLHGQTDRQTQKDEMHT
jgi:hypothetical protein